MKIHGKYMTKKELDKLTQQITDQVVQNLGTSMAKSAQDIMLAASIAILAERFGFGEVRIQRFTDSYMELTESLGVGTDDIDTIKENIIYNFGDVFGREQEQ